MTERRRQPLPYKEADDDLAQPGPFEAAGLNASGAVLAGFTFPFQPPGR